MAGQSQTLFAETERLKATVGVLNAAQLDKLPLVLAKVISFCGVAGEWPFTSAEEGQLAEILGLEAKSVAVLLEGVSYIYETSAYYNLKAAALGQSLLAIGVAEAPAVQLAQVWTAESAGLISRLRAKQFGAPLLLQGTSWRLNLPLASTASSAGKTTEAVLDFRLGTAADDGAGQAGAAAPGRPAPAAGPTEVLSVGFDREQLLGLLNKLDTIQGQLDSLS